MARGNIWSEEEVHALIAIWGEKEIQAQLDGATRNKKVFDKIAEQLTELGFARTGHQCREKIKKLKSDYRRAKDSNNLTGRGRSILIYFTELDAILGCRPTSAPDCVVGSMATVEQEQVESHKQPDETVGVENPSKDAQDGLGNNSTGEYRSVSFVCVLLYVYFR